MVRLKGWRDHNSALRMGYFRVKVMFVAFPRSAPSAFTGSLQGRGTPETSADMDHYIAGMVRQLLSLILTNVLGLTQAGQCRSEAPFGHAWGASVDEALLAASIENLPDITEGASFACIEPAEVLRGSAASMCQSDLMTIVESYWTEYQNSRMSIWCRYTGVLQFFLGRSGIGQGVSMPWVTSVCTAAGIVLSAAELEEVSHPGSQAAAPKTLMSN